MATTKFDKPVGTEFTTMTNTINGKATLAGLQNIMFNQVDASGATSVQTISSYPTIAGIFRVGGTKPVGLPEEAAAYGSLIIFNAGSYWMHEYLDGNSFLFISRTTSATTPTNWQRVSTSYPSEYGARYKYFTTAADGTTFNVANSTRAMLFLCASNANYVGIISVYTTSGGSVSALKVCGASGITVTTATNKLTISGAAVGVFAHLYRTSSTNAGDMSVE